VHIIPDASTVRGIVIVAIDFEMAALAASDFEKQWNDVSFRTMIFARIRCSTRCIEIAKGRDDPTIGGCIPA